MFQLNYKIVAVHHGTKKRFIYGTIGDFSNPDFYGEEYNPTPLPFSVKPVGVAVIRFQKEKPDFRVFADFA